MIKSDRHQRKQLSLSPWLVIMTMLISFGDNRAIAQSQIVPDNTLGNENSQVTPNQNINGLPSEIIEGGAQRGNNLFHSFSQFNVETDRGAYFANPEGIANIFSRVTGSDASEIMGRLGVQGNADLFLLNPNGIIFGENASLDVSGSFVSTTADGIQFGEQGFFNAIEPNAPPLLTVQPSAFLFNQMNPGKIENRSISPAGFDILDRPLLGLRVPNGESLLLLGGEIVIDGGGLHALDGRVELSAIAGEENIELNTAENNPTLTLTPQLQLADISISNGGFLNSSNEGGGEILLRGENINITNGSLLFADSLGDLNGKGISITAENLRLDFSGITTDVLSSGGGGNITIDTKTVNIDNGSTISSSSFGQGNLGDNGNININASETVAINSSSIFNQTASDAVGNGGNIDFSTQELFLTNGSLISTDFFGQGDGGNININARSFSAVEGASLNSNLASGAIGQAGDININANDVTFDGGFARSRLEAGAEGSGGNIQITTGSLLVTGIPPEVADSNTGQLITATFGQGNSGSLRIDASGDVIFDGRGSDVFSLIGGNLADPNIPPAEGNAGDITINAGSLLVTNQARLIGNVEGIGDAGDINIDTNSLSITNEGQLLTEVANTGVGNAGDINIVAQSFDLTNGGRISANTAGFGEAGNIGVSVNNLLVQNGGQILATTFNEGNAGNLTIMASESVSLIGQREPRESFNTGLFVGSQTATATGNGGNLEITTPKLEISDGAALTAIAQGTGNGGNIRLQVQDLLQLRNSSLISTTAGTETTGGDGGNINIDTNFLVAFPNENSDIIANAFEGNGGNIEINAQAVLGIEERQATEGNITNDIDASSEFGLSGVIEIDVPDVDLSAENVKLTTQPTETEVAQVCDYDGLQAQNKFFVSGRSGLPDSPTAALNADIGWEDWQIGEIGFTSSSTTSKISNQAMPLSLSTTNNEQLKIIEAQSWIINDLGKVALIANSTDNSSPEFWQTAPHCQ